MEQKKPDFDSLVIYAKSLLDYATSPLPYTEENAQNFKSKIEDLIHYCKFLSSEYGLIFSRTGYLNRDVGYLVNYDKRIGTDRKRKTFEEKKANLIEEVEHFYKWVKHMSENDQNAQLKI